MPILATPKFVRVSEHSNDADHRLAVACSCPSGVFIRAMVLLVLYPGTVATISTRPPQLITSSAPTTVAVV